MRDLQVNTDTVFSKINEGINSVSRSLNVLADEKKNIKNATERTKSRSPVLSNIKMNLQFPYGTKICSPDEKGKTAAFFQKSNKNHQQKKRSNMLMMNYTSNTINHNTKATTPKSNTELSLLAEHPPSDNEYQLHKPPSKPPMNQDYLKKLASKLLKDPQDFLVAPDPSKPPNNYILNSPIDAQAIAQRNIPDLCKAKKIRAAAHEETDALQ